MLAFYAATERIDYVQLATDMTDALGVTEVDRLRALRFVHDRRDYLAAHVLLRLALERVRGDDPRGAPTDDRRGWSLTHTAGFVACAVASDGRSRVGIDAEPLTAATRLETMADEFSTPAERAGLGLVELWTAKEAALKVRGVGLADAGGLDALRLIECRAGPTLDDWATITLRQVQTGEHHAGWTRHVGGHVLTVVVGDEVEQETPPRLEALHIQ